MFHVTAAVEDDLCTRHCHVTAQIQVSPSEFASPILWVEQQGHHGCMDVEVIVARVCMPIAMIKVLVSQC